MTSSDGRHELLSSLERSRRELEQNFLVVRGLLSRGPGGYRMTTGGPEAWRLADSALPPPGQLEGLHPLPLMPTGRLVPPPNDAICREKFLGGYPVDDIGAFTGRLCGESPQLLNDRYALRIHIDQRAFKVPGLCIAAGRDLGTSEAGHDRLGAFERDLDGLHHGASEVQAYDALATAEHDPLGSRVQAPHSEGVGDPGGSTWPFDRLRRLGLGAFAETTLDEALEPVEERR